MGGIYTIGTGDGTTTTTATRKAERARRDSFSQCACVSGPRVWCVRRWRRARFVGGGGATPAHERRATRRLPKCRPRAGYCPRAQVCLRDRFACARSRFRPAQPAPPRARVPDTTAAAAAAVVPQITHPPSDRHRPTLRPCPLPPRTTTTRHGQRDPPLLAEPVPGRRRGVAAHPDRAAGSAHCRATPGDDTRGPAADRARTPAGYARVVIALHATTAVLPLFLFVSDTYCARRPHAYRYTRTCIIHFIVVRNATLGDGILRTKRDFFRGADDLEN